ncbi:MAG: aldehyde dehydrogenase family protein [Gaiellaceae bacterium]
MLAQLRVIPEWLFYFGGLADKVEGRVIPLDRTSVFNYTLHEPLGVVGIIVPWNSPVLLTMYSLAPALAAGNTVVVKPSEHAPASVLETLRLAEEAGFPPGVLNVVTGAGDVGQALVDHPVVAKIAFTGSETTGKQITARAGARLASVSLELGGKSPNIVFADASLDAAEAGVLAGIFGAAGQSCVAGSRALFQRDVYDELLERVQSRASTVLSEIRWTARHRWGRSPTCLSSSVSSRWSVRRARREPGSSPAALAARWPASPRASSTSRRSSTALRTAPQIAQNEVFGPVQP